MGGAETNYVLTIGEDQGTGGADGMAYHNGAPFTTRDRDNDDHSGRNCAAQHGGAWWYKSCVLNAYHTPENEQLIMVRSSTRLIWYDGSSWQDSHYTKAAMKIRPKIAGCGFPSSTCK